MEDSSCRRITQRAFRRFKRRQYAHPEPKYRVCSTNRVSNFLTKPSENSTPVSHSCIRATEETPATSAATPKASLPFPPDAPSIRPEPENDEFGPLVTPHLRSIFEKLPPELYIVLLSNMSLPEGVLLSLTCKQLWAQLTLKSSYLYCTKRCASLDDRMTLLTRLERDQPSLIFCMYCLKLHSRLRDEAGSLLQRSHADSERRPCSSPPGTVDVGPSRHMFNIYREALELMIRASSLGTEYGMSTDNIRRSVKWKEHGALPVHINWACEGLIAQDSEVDLRTLIIRAEYQVETDLERPIQEQVCASQAKACGHDRGAEREPMRRLLRAARLYSEIERNLAKDLKYVSPTDYYQRTSCPTDTAIAVDKQPGEAFAVLIVTAWRDLGTSGNDASRQWRQQADSWSAKDFRRQPEYMYGNQHLQHVYERNKQQQSTCNSE